MRSITAAHRKERRLSGEREGMIMDKSKKIRLPVKIANAAAAAAAFALYFVLCYRAWDGPYAPNADTRLYGSLLAALAGALPLAFGRYAYTLSFLLSFLLGVRENRRFAEAGMTASDAVRTSKMLVILFAQCGAILGVLLEFALTCWLGRREGVGTVLSRLLKNRFVQAGLVFLCLAVAMGDPLFRNGRYWPGERVMLVCCAGALPFLFRYYATGGLYLIGYVVANQIGNARSVMAHPYGTVPYGTANGGMTHLMLVVLFVLLGLAADTARLLYRRCAGKREKPNEREEKAQ